MSLVKNPAIDSLVQSSLESEDDDLRLGWIPCSQITDIEPTQIDNVHYAIYKRKRSSHGRVEETTITLSLLGNDEICTPTLVSEFDRIYSLSTSKYKNDVSQYRRYKEWLKSRNFWIRGFTK